MSPLIRLYRYFSLLSLDVVAGAVMSALFFARILSVSARPIGLIALGLTVWVIYTADHLRDAKNIIGEASTERHRFHQIHHKQLMVALGISVVVDAVTILFIRQQVLEWGLVLGFAVLIYLVVQKSLKFLKEIFISVLYTLGVLLLSVPVTETNLTATHYLLIVQFGLTALTNLLMFSWFDRDVDLHDKQNSFVTRAGDQITRMCIWSLLFLLLSLTVFQYFVQVGAGPTLILGCMGLILTMIFLFRSTLAENDYYRLLGDAIFILPAIYLL